MPKRALESLGALVKTKRGSRKLRETASEIGIGPATLMRIENGRMPDLGTFARVCKWLGVDPGDFLGFEQERHPKISDVVTLSAHFRADQTPNPNTVSAIAQMIALAVQGQSKIQQQPNA